MRHPHTTSGLSPTVLHMFKPSVIRWATPCTLDMLTGRVHRCKPWGVATGGRSIKNVEHDDKTQYEPQQSNTNTISSRRPRSYPVGHEQRNSHASHPYSAFWDVFLLVQTRWGEWQLRCTIQNRHIFDRLRWEIIDRTDQVVETWHISLFVSIWYNSYCGVEKL